MSLAGTMCYVNDMLTSVSPSGQGNCGAPPLTTLTHSIYMTFCLGLKKNIVGLGPAASV